MATTGTMGIIYAREIVDLATGKVMTIKELLDSASGGGAVQWGDLEGKPVVIAAGDDQAAARLSIGAGTSNLSIGTAASNAMAGNKFAVGAAVSDQTALSVAGDDAPAVATSAQAAVTALTAKVNALLAALRTSKIINT